MSQDIIRSAKELLDYITQNPEEAEQNGISLSDVQSIYDTALEEYPQEKSPEEQLKPEEFNPIISPEIIPQEEALGSTTAVESLLTKTPLDPRLFKAKETNINPDGTTREIGVIRKSLEPTKSTGYDWDTKIVDDKKILETLQQPILMTQGMSDEEITEYAKVTAERKKLERDGYSIIDINNDAPDSVGDPLKRGIATAQQAIGSAVNTIPLFIQSPELKWVQDKTNTLLMDKGFIDSTKDIPNRYAEAKKVADAEYQVMRLADTLPDNVKDALKSQDETEQFFYELGNEIKTYWADAWTPKNEEGERGFIEDMFTADPPTGEYAEPPENFLDYLDPMRVYMVGAETAPMMGMFMATTIANPVAGTALMFAIEAGSSKEGILDYEKATGKRVDEDLRNSVPIMVGAFNAVLEKFGLDRVMKGAGLRSRFLNILVGSISEGTTEGFQEVSQIIGEQLTQEEKELFKFTEEDWERTIASFYAGTVMGAGGTTVSNTLDTEGRLVYDMQKSVDKYEVDNDITGNDSWSEVNRALDANEIDSDMGTWVKFFLSKNKDFDKAGVLKITKELRVIMQDEKIQEYIDGGLSREEAENAYRIWAESEQLKDTSAQILRIKGSTTIDHDLRKVVVNLFGGADKTTVIEEMYGALYKSLSPEERQAVEDEFRENNPDKIADLETELKNSGWSQLLNEDFQKRGLKWYQEEGVQINQSRVDKALTRFGQKISKFLSTADEISPLGDKTMELVKGFGEGTKGITELYSNEAEETMQADIIEVDHYSNTSDLSSIDPSFYGTGKTNKKEKAGQKLNRSFFYKGGDEVEGALRDSKYKYKAKLDTSNLYDMSTDELGIAKKASSDIILDEMLVEAGYDGFIADPKTFGREAYVKFTPTEVISSSPRGFLFNDRDGDISDNTFANKVLADIKALPKSEEGGATFNLEGQEYTDGGLVIPITSKNFTSAINVRGINNFLIENTGKIEGDNVKVGVYKFPDKEVGDSPYQSIDLNIVIPSEHRELGIRIGKALGQESLFDLGTFENIKTGADGKNPLSLKDIDFKEIAVFAKNEGKGDVPVSIRETFQVDNLRVDEIAKKYASKEPITKGMGRAGVATDKGLGEVLKVLTDDGFDINGALEWYNEAVSEAKGIGSIEVPLIKSHKNGDALWDIFMGMTSLGTKIPPNYDSGISILKTYLETGKINYVQNDKGSTLIEYENSEGIPKKIRMPIIADMFKKFEGLVSEFGEDGAIEWLMTPHSGVEIAELNAKLAGKKPGTKKKPSGITLDGEYYGARILGPKIGRYIMNLHGVHEEATYDIWWTRTWNRWMGTPFTEKGDLKNAPSWGTESQAMDEAMENIKSKLNELTDREWNVAEIQAVLWYHEKQLYVRHGQKDDGLNYGNVAKLRAEKKGYYEEYATPVSDKSTGQIEEGRSSGQQEADANTEGRTGKTPKETKQKSSPLKQETMQAVPLWESKILKAVNRLGSKKYPQKRIPVRSVKNYLRNQGVSEEEMKWAGIDIIEAMPFGEKSISVRVLQNHIKNNNLQMTEILRGGNPEYDKVRADWLVAESRMGDLRLELQEKAEAQEGSLTSKGLNKLRKEFQDSIMREAELYLAMAKLEEGIDFEKEPRHDAYKVPSRSQEFDTAPSDYKEMEITIPDDATTGIFKVEGHFPDNNIIAFVRFDTRTKDGKKVLFIEEIQSDWHHKGDAEGYQGYFKKLTKLPDNYRIRKVDNIWGGATEDWAGGTSRPGYILEFHGDGKWHNVKTLSERAMSEDTMERAEKFFLRTMNDKNLNLERRKVPDAPFKESWMRLAQKRMLRYAVDNKFDSIEWATGVESADMYDIRKEFDSLTYEKFPNGSILIHVYKDGSGSSITDLDTTKDKLPGYFGKDITNQIIRGEGEAIGGNATRLEAKDMVMGGEFHKEFYDVRVPQAFKKVIKPFGGKVVSGEHRNSIELTSEMNEAFARPQETFQAEVMPDELYAEAIQRKLQDKLNRLKKAQDILKIDDEEMDAYLNTELYLSKVRHQLDLNEVEVDDFLKNIKDKDMSLDEIATFLYAQHARERDAVIKERDPKVEFDASGWDNEAMGGTPESFLPGGKNYKKGIKAVANKFRNRFVNKRLDILFEAGLITEEAYNGFKSGEVYSNYVPLKGIANAEEFSGTGRGFNLTGKDIKQAKGRSTVANSPLTQILEDVNQTIIRAEKNRVAQSLYLLIKNNELTMPDGSPYWEVKNIRYKPSYDKHGEVQSLIPENLDTSKEMIVYFDGKAKKIIIHDKTLYDNLNNLGQGKGFAFFSKAVNTLRNLYTTLSPTFWITNFQRDSQMNALMHVAQGRSDIALATIKNIPMAKVGISMALLGKKGEWVDIYNDFLDNGGKMGWVESMSIEERTAELDKKLKKAQGKNPVMGVVKGLFGVIEGINTVFESSTRLATYKSLLDAGYSKKKASQIAKNITVNFNKKGEWGQTINTAYLFSNAAIQGGFNVAKGLFTTKRGLALTGTLYTAGYAVASMMRADDEEEYDKLNDYERFTKLMIPKPSGGYVPISLPYGLNFPYAVGVITEEITNGNITPQEAGAKMLFLLATTFSPVQGADVVDAVTPTLAKPLAQWLRNKKYHGGKIKPDGYGTDEMAPSSNYYDSANPLSIKFTKFLNESTGGTDVRAGGLSMSPNNIDGIVEWTGPLLNSIWDVAGGKEFDNMNIKKLVHIEAKDYKPRQIMYDILEKSKTKKLSPTQMARYDRYKKIALKSGSATEEQVELQEAEIKKYQSRVNLSPSRATIRINVMQGHKKLLRKKDLTEQDIQEYTEQLDKAYYDYNDIMSEGEYNYRVNYIDKVWEKLEEDN